MDNPVAPRAGITVAVSDTGGWSPSHRTMRSAGTKCRARSAKSKTNRPARVLQTVIVVRQGAIDEAGVDGVKHGAAPARVNKVRVPQADRSADAT
jgi:hypothetical protein